MIYLVRHAEPAASWGAHPDPGLSALGIRQACAAAENLASAGAKWAVTSPLARSRGTAAEFEKRIETHARIEPAVGEIMAPQGIADRSAWLQTIMTGQWSGVEAGLQRWRRSILEAVDRLQDDTAVFSHFVAINALVGLLSDDDRVVVFKPAHASITRLVRRNGSLALAELGSEAPAVVL